jgi:hypothetical protein
MDGASDRAKAGPINDFEYYPLNLDFAITRFQNTRSLSDRLKAAASTLCTTDKASAIVRIEDLLFDKVHSTSKEFCPMLFIYSILQK